MKEWVRFIAAFTGVNESSALTTIKLRLELDHNNHEGTSELNFRPETDFRGDFSKGVTSALETWKEAIDVKNDDEALARLKKVFASASKIGLFNNAMRAAGLDLPADTSTTESSRQAQKPQEAAPTEPIETKPKRSQDEGDGNTAGKDEPFKLEKYPIKEKKGKVLIIKNDVLGSEADVKRIKEVLGKMGTPEKDIRLIKDKTLKEIEDDLELFSGIDFEDYSYVCCFVTSHGYSKRVHVEDKSYGIDLKEVKSDSFFCAKDGYMTTDELTGYFKGKEKKSLLDKPKLFFIDICRGPKSDEGHREGLPQQVQKDVRVHPIESDIFIFHASTIDYKASCNSDGGYFTRILCDVLERNYEKSDLMKMGTIVNEKVSQEHERIRNESQLNQTGIKKAQMPEMTATLRKEFYFVEQEK